MPNGKVNPSMASRSFLPGFLFSCLAGGFIYLALIYPVFRLFHPNHPTDKIDTAGPYGFSSDWTCSGIRLSSTVCWNQKVFDHKAQSAAKTP
jgi:hypothetical protein